MVEKMDNVTALNAVKNVEAVNEVKVEAPEPSKEDVKDVAEEQETFEISERAKELFDREKGIRSAIHYLSEMLGKANNASWQQVFEEHPSVEGKMAMYEEKEERVRLIKPEELTPQQQPTPQAPAQEAK